jgi:hypothetical protein
MGRGTLTASKVKDDKKKVKITGLDPGDPQGIAIGNIIPLDGTLPPGHHRDEPIKFTFNSDKKINASSIRKQDITLGEFQLSGPEGSSVTLSVPSDVAFGANGLFYYKRNQIGPIVFDNGTFGDPAPNIPKAGYVRNFQLVAQEGGSFAVTRPVVAAYGAQGKFFYKFDLTGTINFNPGFFGGDPIVGVRKAGYIKYYEEVAAERDSIEINGTANLAFGVQGGAFKYLDNRTGQVQFTNDFFGGDPDKGTRKNGYICRL